MMASRNALAAFSCFSMRFVSADVGDRCDPADHIAGGIPIWRISGLNILELTTRWAVRLA